MRIILITIEQKKKKKESAGGEQKKNLHFTHSQKRVGSPYFQVPMFKSKSLRRTLKQVK